LRLAPDTDIREDFADETMEKMLPIEADLTLLRTQLPTKRRQSRRFRCNLATMAKVQLHESDQIKVTWAYNLSQGGVGLNSPTPLEFDQTVSIHFRVDGKEVKILPAKIIFCRMEIDRSWRIGCAFLDILSHDTLDSLLN
jgi:hypothetical protein